MQSRDKLLCNSDNKYRLGNPGRKPLFHLNGIEYQLFQWIISERSKGYIITLTDIQQKMRWLTVDYQFKASTGWLYGFIRRYQLSLRVPNSCIPRNPIDILMTVFGNITIILLKYTLLIPLMILLMLIRPLFGGIVCMINSVLLPSKVSIKYPL